MPRVMSIAVEVALPERRSVGGTHLAFGRIRAALDAAEATLRQGPTGSSPEAQRHANEVVRAFMWAVAEAF